MNRAEKQAEVEDLAGRMADAEAVFAIDYRGLGVSEAAELRARLRESGATFRVTKNRLTKLAAAKAGQEGLDELLTGPTALTFVSGDSAAAAKALRTFSRQHEVLEFKGGLLGDSVLDTASFEAIAQLPSRDALNGQLAGVVASPLTGLVRGLGSMLPGLAAALQQVADQGLVGQSEPAAAEKPAEASAEEPAEPEASAEEAAQEETSQSSDEKEE